MSKLLRALAVWAVVLPTANALRAAEAVNGDALPAWAARQSDKGAAVRVAVPPPADKRFAHLAWPKAIRAKDGTIVLAYLAGPLHGSAGCPAISISTDAGKTFTPPNVLREFGKEKDYANSGNLALTQADDGAIVLLAMAHTESTNNIFGWRSTDSGKTWQPTDTSALGPNKTGSVTSLINSPGIGLIACGHYRAGTKEHPRGIWFATSRDQGRTWSDPSPINDLNAGEPVMVQAGERLLVFIRSRDVPQSKQYVAVSDDKGKTWKTQLTEIGVEKGVGTLAHPFAIMNPDKPGELLVLTCERSSHGRVVLWQGDPQKLEFTRGRTVLEFPKIADDKHTDYGYTWLVPMEKGRGLMFYYHGLGKGENPIWVAEIKY